MRDAVTTTVNVIKTAKTITMFQIGGAGVLGTITVELGASVGGCVGEGEGVGGVSSTNSTE